MNFCQTTFWRVIVASITEQDLRSLNEACSKSEELVWQTVQETKSLSVSVNANVLEMLMPLRFICKFST
jgi:hypothetical protein